MNEAKVSVIVPVYNTECYLKECLDSLVHQTLQEIQIVIIDDGSTDSSPAIIGEYAAKYPEKILAIRQENGGQGKARNAAFACCTGEYIGFLDSDDYAKPDMFEKMYARAARENLDCAACGYASFVMEGGQMRVLDPYHGSPICKETKDMFLGMYASSCLHLIRRSILNNNQIRYTEGRIYEDTAFFAKLIPYLSSIGYVKEAMVMRRMRRNSTITTISKDRVLQMLDVMDDINNFFDRNTLAAYMALKECFCVRILLCSHMERICLVASWKERRELVNRVLAYIERNYPNFRKNRYFTGGLKNAYVRTANSLSVNAMCEALRVKKILGKKYV